MARNAAVFDSVKNTPNAPDGHGDNRRKVNQMKHEAIKAAWAARNRLLAEGDKLRVESGKLREDGGKRYAKLHAESDKLYIEGRRLYIEGRRLYVAGRKVYRDAVVEKYGNDAGINWETGEITIGEALIIMGEGE